MFSIEFLPFDFGPEISDHRHTRQLNIKPPGWGSVSIKIKRLSSAGFANCLIHYENNNAVVTNIIIKIIAVVVSHK